MLTASSAFPFSTSRVCQSYSGYIRVMTPEDIEADRKRLAELRLTLFVDDQVCLFLSLEEKKFTRCFRNFLRDNQSSTSGVENKLSPILKQPITLLRGITTIPRKHSVTLI